MISLFQPAEGFYQGRNGDADEEAQEFKCSDEWGSYISIVMDHLMSEGLLLVNVPFHKICETIRDVTFESDSISSRKAKGALMSLRPSIWWCHHAKMDMIRFIEHQLSSKTVHWKEYIKEMARVSLGCTTSVSR